MSATPKSTEDTVRRLTVVDIGKLYAAIPDCLRIDHDRRAQLTLIQTAGRIRSHQRLQTPPLDFFLERVAQCLAPVCVAAPA